MITCDQAPAGIRLPAGGGEAECDEISKLVELKGAQSNQLTALFEELEGWNRALKGSCIDRLAPKP